MAQVSPRLPSPSVLIAVLAVAVLIPTCRISAATLLVQEDYETIQEAIDEAEDGDTIEVEAGTYLENIDYLGKAITIIAVDGPEETTIIGSEPSDSDFGSCVTFSTSEGLDSVLDGFTLTDGTGTVVELNDTLTTAVGGGILCVGASPTIVNCVIEDNEGSGGIFLGDGSEAEIADCVIQDHVDTGLFIRGESDVTLESVIIRDNSGYAGGVSMRESSATFLSCTIEDNASTLGTAGVYVTANSVVSFVSCDIRGNEGGFFGGGIVIHGDDPGVGILRVPVGATWLFVAVLLTAREVR